MNEFRKEERHCDVTIHVGEQKYPCHRLVLSSSSTYFNAMFAGNFNESEADNITLQEIDSNTFEEILNAMYTSEIICTPQNVCRLLKACSFLGMPTFEKRCLSYIEENLPVDDLPEICSFAKLIDEKPLFDKIISYLALNFIALSKTYDFSELSADILMCIFEHKCLISNDNVAFVVIANWAKKNPNSNVDSIMELLDAAKLEKINMLTMAKLLATRSDDDTISKVIYPEIKLEITAESFRRSLKVYMQTVRQDSGTSDFVTLSLNDQNKWILLNSFNASFHNLKTTVLDNVQYFLAYDTKPMDKPRNIFWMQKDGEITHLRPPPVITPVYHMTAIDNMIFLYCSQCFEAETVDVASYFKPLKVAKPCVFVYNCELDSWFSISKTLSSVTERATFVAGDRMLYLIGGSGNTLTRYDYRRQEWIALANLPQHHYDAAACAYEDKLYVCGSYDNDAFSSNVSHYDITATAWSIGNKMKFARAKHVLVPYKNYLYAIDNRPLSYVEKYDSAATEWLEASCLPKKVGRGDFIWSTHHITDGGVH